MAFCHRVFLAITCATGKPEKRWHPLNTLMVHFVKTPYPVLHATSKWSVLVSDILKLVPRRALLTRCPREVWERVGESLSETSQFTVESRFDRAEYAEGLA